MAQNLDLLCPTINTSYNICVVPSEDVAALMNVDGHAEIPVEIMKSVPATSDVNERRGLRLRTGFMLGRSTLKA